ncbi:MAG: hypothetical protein J0I29_11375 [Rhizobiales bacterium]|nr:hypothetical protein [Hyphomicrobiales bacterium]
MRRTVKTKLHAFSVAVFAAAAFTAPARADVVMREADIVNLRLGQKVYVDDGICPSGQIKLVTGAKLGPAGVQRTKQCVDRKGIKR